jgi:hypothetical protein
MLRCALSRILSGTELIFYYPVMDTAHENIATCIFSQHLSYLFIYLFIIYPLCVCVCVLPSIHCISPRVVQGIFGYISSSGCRI